MSLKPEKRAPPEGTGTAAPSPWRACALPGADGLAGLMLLCATLAAYAPVWRAGFIWDDDGHVTRADLRPLRGLWRIWSEPGATQQYYPLLHSAFWLEHRLWGDSPLGYHLANIVLHAAAAFLLYRVLRTLRLPGALLGASAFALHPVCVESVAWVSEQKNTLSAVFYMAAALAYLRFDGERRSRWYVLASGLFLMALATKSVTATLPAALLVVLWWRRGRLSWMRDVLPLAPWLCMGAAAGLVTAWVERTYIGASGAPFRLGVGGALPRGRQGRLVLPGKDRLARRPGLHLPAMGRGRARAVAVPVSRPRRPRCLRSSSRFAAARAARSPPRCSSPARSFPPSDSSTCTRSCTPLSPTTSSTWPRPSPCRPARRRLSAASAGLPRIAARGRGGLPGRRPRVAHFAPMRGIRRRRGTLAGDDRGQSGLLDGLGEPRRRPHEGGTHGQSDRAVPGGAGGQARRRRGDERAGRRGAAAGTDRPGRRAVPPGARDIARPRRDPHQPRRRAPGKGKAGRGGGPFHGRARHRARQREGATRTSPRPHAQEGRWHDAAEQYSRAAEGEPGDAELQVSLGSALARDGRLEAAEARFRRALELSEGSPTAHFNLANALTREGKDDDAVAHFSGPWRSTPDLPRPTTTSQTQLAQEGRAGRRRRPFPEGRRAGRPIRRGAIQPRATSCCSSAARTRPWSSSGGPRRSGRTSPRRTTILPTPFSRRAGGRKPPPSFGRPCVAGARQRAGPKRPRGRPARAGPRR